MKISILVALILTYIPTQAFELDEGWMREASATAIVVHKKYDSLIREAYDFNFLLPKSIIAGIVVVETHGDPTKVGKSGEIGLGQIIPEKAEADLRRLYPHKRFDGDLREPSYNIYVLMSYLKALSSHYGFSTIEQALVAYHIGPTAARRISYVDAFRDEYVQKVFYAAAHYPQ